MGRLDDLRRFYGLLSELESRLGGTRCLSGCHGRIRWPQRGIYFFFEPGERRTDSGRGLRVVRVGTHALAAGSKTTLWHRLSQHRGTGKTGGGNHRGSIFRLLVGEALKARSGESYPQSWGVKGDPGKAAAQFGCAREEIKAEEIKAQEQGLEIAVSRHIGAMPFLWLNIEDAPGPDSQRGLLERNAIALLSNRNKPPLDRPSASWLGSDSLRERVRESGLWNNNHVDENYEGSFLDTLEYLVDKA